MQALGEKLIDRNNRIERESDKLGADKQTWLVDGHGDGSQKPGQSERDGTVESA